MQQICYWSYRWAMWYLEKFKSLFICENFFLFRVQHSKFLLKEANAHILSEINIARVNRFYAHTNSNKIWKKKATKDRCSSLNTPVMIVGDMNFKTNKILQAQFRSNKGKKASPLNCWYFQQYSRRHLWRDRQRPSLSSVAYQSSLAHLKAERRKWSI